jgi:hypothetical protein
VGPSEQLEALRGRKVLEIAGDELEALLAAATLVREVDTGMCREIRVLRLEGRVLVQEHSKRGRILLRGFDDLDAADEFVRSRLQTYERMWDGCGCRIDYDE